MIRDKEMALACAGGSKELADELFGMLLAELPRRRRELHDHLISRDVAELYRTVHNINGSATYCGVPALKDAAVTLEVHLKQGETGALQNEVEHLVHEIDRVLASA